MQAQHIGFLQPADDPQQIFESINATGRPLTESEKIKNWLLMGLPDDVQQDLHDNYWLDIERRLDARYTTEPVDIFLRDLLRWQTGEVHGVKQVYPEVRAVVSQWARDDEAGWPDAAHWLKDQHDRLRVIAEAPSR